MHQPLFKLSTTDMALHGAHYQTKYHDNIIALFEKYVKDATNPAINRAECKMLVSHDLGVRWQYYVPEGADLHDDEKATIDEAELEQMRLRTLLTYSHEAHTLREFLPNGATIQSQKARFYYSANGRPNAFFRYYCVSEGRIVDLTYLIAKVTRARTNTEAHRDTYGLMVEDYSEYLVNALSLALHAHTNAFTVIAI